MIPVRKILQLLNLNQSPKQLAWSVSLGFCLGLLPLISPLSWLFLVLLIALRVNYAVVALSWAVGEVLALAIHGLFSYSGELVLQLAALSDLWQALYASAFWRFIGYNHTYVMGSTLLLPFLFIALWWLAYQGLKRYQQAAESGLLKGFANARMLGFIFHRGQNQSNLTGVRAWLNIPLLGIASLTLVAVLLVSYLISTSQLSRQVEAALQQIWQAPVQIGSINLSVSPLGFEFRDIEFADRQENSKQAMALARGVATINLYQLIAERLVFDEIAIDGAVFDIDRLDTNQPKPGSAAAKDESQPKVFKTPSLPSLQQILAKEELKTTKAVESIQADKSTIQQQLQTMQAAIPTQQQFQAYKKQVEQLKASKPSLTDLAGLSKQAQQAIQLKQAIGQQIEQLEQHQSILKQATQQLKQKLAELPDLVAQDQRAVQDKYSFNRPGSAGFAKVFWGQQLGNRISQLGNLYQIVSPYVTSTIDFYQRHRATNQQQKAERPDWFSFGRYIAFPEQRPQPNFNVKNLFLRAADQSLALNLQNLNLEHPTSQLPTKGWFKEANSSTLTISIDYTGAAGVIKLELPEHIQELDNRSLVSTDYLSLAVQSAKLVENMSISINTDGGLSGLWQYTYQDIQWDFEAMREATFNRLQPETFKRIERFFVRAKIAGGLTAPSLSLQSDLDGPLYQQLQQTLKQAERDFQAELNTQLNQQAQTAIQSVRQQLMEVTQVQNQLNTAHSKWQQQLWQKI